jgi:hypothetical protein
VRRAGAVVALVAWTASLACALGFLHRMEPTAPALPGDGSAYVILTVRYLAIGVGWYLAVTTAISFIGHVLRTGASLTIAARFTATPINRLTRAAVGAAFAASTVLPAAAAAEAPPPAPVMMWVEEQKQEAPEAPAAPASPPLAGAGSEVVIEPGDSFWSLASRRLAEHLQRPPSAREITPYWAEVVSANTDRLRAPGEPDLIYPGDRVVLPPP